MAGCSLNRRAFRSMYRDVPFQGEDLGQIERDLLETQGPGGKG